MEKVREVSSLFFRSSVEEKKKCLRADDDVEGYGNGMVLSDQQTIDWNDRLYLTVLPKHQQRLQFWPQNPSRFRTGLLWGCNIHFTGIIDEYNSKVHVNRLKFDKVTSQHATSLRPKDRRNLPGDHVSPVKTVWTCQSKSVCLLRCLGLDMNQAMEVLDEYSSKIELINEVVLKALARSLNLEENCFLNQYGTNSSMNARFNYYPPCEWPDKVLGVKPNADASAITVLLQDKEVEGLQILKDDQWVGVPIVRDALTINVGDLMEIMSNGIFKSPVHRVLINSENERMTVAMFCMPQTERDIGPVDELISDETPRLYKNVTFTLDFFSKNYQQGRRAIDAWKI
ncbi:hypothetical protein L6452_02919 [Arctium lappa]|uniref:Uncharacterized protein n=1 Tax=Arctium lappa TaxID=4217 RepID=A0ACB9FKR0_ARCLA|nr:hypothetical protein L6452_02919 [Arctium lappa]